MLLSLTSYYAIIDGNATTSTAINDALPPCATREQTSAARQQKNSDYYIQVEVDVVIHVIYEKLQIITMTC